jgi:NAD(P)-dependent dehydrogenase (short-subunit alcohol dehydrogenase family)
MGRLQAQVAIVTGGGRGIGREIARAFAREGAAVAVVSRTQGQVAETVSLIRGQGGRAVAIPADVTDLAAVEAAVGRVESELGPVDVLMNNAGSFNAIGPVVEVDPGDWWGDVTTNLLGTFHACRAVLKGMLARRRGRIINMIGGGTAAAFPYGSGYGSSKAAVMRLTESLDREVAETGVRVFAMGPGLVRTAMTELQLVTEAGRRWMTRIHEMFAQGKDVPPAMAAALAVEIASGRLDELRGRAFGVRDDLDHVLANKERILAEDLKTLRLVELK